MSNKLSTKKRAFDWWDMTPQQRFDAKLPINEDAFRETLSVVPATYKTWKEEHKKRKELAVANAEYKNEFPQSEKAEVLEDLRIACSRGNAFACKVWLQAKGELVEKSESKVEFKLSAGENIGIAREAERRISELHRESDGNTSLSQEPALLSN